MKYGRAGDTFAGVSIGLAAAVAVWASLTFPSPLLQGAAALVLAMTMAAHMRPDRRILLLSPLLLLGSGALVFFCLLPAAMRPWSNPSIYWVYAVRAEAYHRQPAESLIIVFSMLCLGGQAALLLGVRRRLAAGRPPWPPLPAAAALAAAGAAAILMVAALGRWWPPAAALATLPIGRDLVDAAPTVATFALAYLALTPSAAPPVRRHAVLAVLAVTVIAAMLLKGEGKKVAFLILGLGFTWAAYPALKSATLLKTGAVIALLACLGAANTMAGLDTSLRPGLHPVVFGARALFESKIWGRQLESGLCLQGVINASRATPPTAPPYYFAAALVPRYLWPDKPSLSKGQDHSVRYCGNPPEMHHSASITLLGEPLAEAGPAGLATAMALLVFGLAAVAWLGLTGGPVGLAMLAAMMPLLMDFDQSFAMYLANAVKFGGITLPLAVWIARRRKDRPEFDVSIKP